MASECSKCTNKVKPDNFYGCFYTCPYLEQEIKDEFMKIYKKYKEQKSNGNT